MKGKCLEWRDNPINTFQCHSNVFVCAHILVMRPRIGTWIEIWQTQLLIDFVYDLAQIRRLRSVNFAFAIAIAIIIFHSTNTVPSMPVPLHWNSFQCFIFCALHSLNGHPITLVFIQKMQFATSERKEIPWKMNIFALEKNFNILLLLCVVSLKN